MDGQTLEAFGADLAGNLYKIWNRMSSGSYFPPPVRAVSIPKKTGGERILGVPTVSDRIAQMVVKQMIGYCINQPVTHRGPAVEPAMFVLVQGGVSPPASRRTAREPLSLSVILCARHNRREGAYYAEQIKGGNA